MRILVPLDGSPLAEAALSKAFALAKLPDAEVVLLQVVAPITRVIENGDRITVDQQWETERQQALSYLEAVRSRPGWAGASVRVAVEMGDPAETIVDYAERTGMDWIVISTHGRSGVRRWVYGSVADKVLRGATTTVALVRAAGPGRPTS
ncbi:MAG: universal stress protein [Acidobacteria bacterium]|nr:MAG: universal stress protein [Acidobacteriota bacterium]